jgi:predicted DNA-binding transcriptional regulator YafY
MDEDRTRRLLGIIIMLQCNNGATTAELAKMFRVEQRTIFRDIQVLRRSGVPLESVPGRRGGICLKESNLLESKLITDKDAFRQFLLCSVGSGQVLDPLPELQSAFHSSFDSLPKAQKQLLERLTKRVIVDTRDWFWHPPDTRFLSFLRAAVIETRKIRASLIQRDGALLDSAVLLPLGLVWKSGEWYLISMVGDTDIRRDRVSRFKEVSVLADTFVYPDNFALREWWERDLNVFGCGNIRVSFTVSGRSVELFERLQLKANSQKTMTEAGIRFDLLADSFSWLVPLLIAHADNITVHEPSTLRKALVDWLDNALARQKGLLSEVDNPDPSADLRLRGSEKNIISD